MEDRTNKAERENVWRELLGHRDKINKQIDRERERERERDEEREATHNQWPIL